MLGDVKPTNEEVGEKILKLAEEMGELCKDYAEYLTCSERLQLGAIRGQLVNKASALLATRALRKAS